MSSWINFCKEYATKNGIGYGQALQSVDCKTTYHKTKLKEVKEKPKLDHDPIKAKPKKTKVDKTLDEGVPKVKAPRKAKRTLIEPGGDEPTMIEQFEARVYGNKGTK